MALPVVFSPWAISQLDQLQSYIADKSYAERAIRYKRRLLRFCNSLGLAPHRGENLDALRPGLRSAGFEKRVKVFFHVASSQLTIIGIYCAGRQPRPDELEEGL